MPQLKKREPKAAEESMKNEYMTAIHGELLILGYLCSYSKGSLLQIATYYREYITHFRPSLFTIMPYILEEKGYLMKSMQKNRPYYKITARGRAYYYKRLFGYRQLIGEMDVCLDRLL